MGIDKEKTFSWVKRTPGGREEGREEEREGGREGAYLEAATASSEVEKGVSLQKGVLVLHYTGGKGT